MLKKRFSLIFFVVIVVIIVSGLFSIRFFKGKNTVVSEYTPEVEMGEEQVKQTIVSLYFLDRDKEYVVAEPRLVEVKKFMEMPYQMLVDLLIKGPESSKNEKLIPDGTNLIDGYLENDCVILNFSKELLEYNKEKGDIKQKMVDSIVNTLTELAEINSVKFLIEGLENSEFSDIYVRNVNGV